MARALCPSFPLSFQSEFLSQLPLNCLFVPMFLLGSINQNVFTCPKSVMLNQIDQFLREAVSSFSNRSAIFKHTSKKSFNFPGSQYLLLPLSLGTVWVRRGLCNENILIRCSPSFWKCLSPFVVLWTWWKFLSDMLVIVLIHISFPICISVVAWLTASCFKYSEAHNKLLRSCHSSSYCETYALVLCPSPHTILLLYSVPSDQWYFSSISPSKWLYPKILSAWAMLEEDLELGCNAFSLS